MIESETRRAVHRFFAIRGEALLFYAHEEDGQVLFWPGPAARKHPLAFVRLLKRERARVAGAFFSLDHPGDPCMLRIAHILGVEVPDGRPCRVVL